CVFFFQAEDGIRDLTVTGVQTCALPICTGLKVSPAKASPSTSSKLRTRIGNLRPDLTHSDRHGPPNSSRNHFFAPSQCLKPKHRSEERRVGKECRSRWATVH